MNHSYFDDIIQRRRSNRKFDTNVVVPNEVIERSLQRAILSPNSSNMQLWEFYWLQSETEKTKFHSLCLNQNAAKTAAHLIVFVTRKDYWKKRAEWNVATARKNIVGEPTPIQKKILDYYTKLMPIAYSSDWLGITNSIKQLISFCIGLFKPFYRMGGKADQRIKVHKSCALAAQTFMLSITAEGYDTCPMEGFDALRVRKALQLPCGAEINMIVAVGKGTDAGIWGSRNRVPYEAVVLVR